jgi:hypothetical protein
MQQKNQFFSQDFFVPHPLFAPILNNLMMSPFTRNRPNANKPGPAANTPLNPVSAALTYINIKAVHGGVKLNFDEFIF